MLRRGPFRKEHNRFACHQELVVRVDYHWLEQVPEIQEPTLADIGGVGGNCERYRKV